MTKLSTLEQFSQLYIDRTLSRVKHEKLLSDSEYANKIFFHYWAFERAGASNAYKVAAVKTLNKVTSIGDKNQSLKSLFREFCSGKLNEKNNPLLDPRLWKFDVTEIISNINQGLLKTAFEKLTLNGINHKIRSFFIRDILYLLGKEDILLDDYKNALFAFPVDVWIRETLKYLEIPSRSVSDLDQHDYGNLSKSDRELATSTILECYSKKVSPIKLNMGIWYFCSNFVADAQRLKTVLRNGDDAVIEEASAFRDLF